MESERRGVNPGLYWGFLGSEVHDLIYDLMTRLWQLCVGQTERGQGGSRFVAVVEAQGHGDVSVWQRWRREVGRSGGCFSGKTGFLLPSADREKEYGREMKGQSRRATALTSVTMLLRLLMSILSVFTGLPSGLR